MLLSEEFTPKNKKPGRKPGFQNQISFKNYFVIEESFIIDEESDIIEEESVATTAEESIVLTAIVSTEEVSVFFSPPQEAKAKTEATTIKRIEFFIGSVFNVYTIIGKLN